MTCVQVYDILKTQGKERPKTNNDSPKGQEENEMTLNELRNKYNTINEHCTMIAFLKKIHHDSSVKEEETRFLANLQLINEIEKLDFDTTYQIKKEFESFVNSCPTEWERDCIVTDEELEEDSI